MRAGRIRRWPLHPPPSPGEALSSWLDRLAALYGLSVRQLLDHNLGSASPVATAVREEDLDWDPPQPVLQALAERTGVDLAELRLLTMAGWQPWLADMLDPDEGPEAFHTYVRQDSVLLREGEAGLNSVQRWLPWLPLEWGHRDTIRRVCPVCVNKPDRGVPLTAALPLMISCPEHGCRLEPEAPVRVGVAMGEPLPARPVAEPVAALDRLTWQALTTGAVALPGRTVHVGRWLRLLRTLLDEVSISTSRVRMASAGVLDCVWEASGWPPRGGITVWRPYERLLGHQQEAMLTAAATAVHLAPDGQIMPRGTLGSLLVPPRHQAVYDGDRPSTNDRWAQLRQEIEAFLDLAKTDTLSARQVLHIFTWRCKTLAAFDRERQFLIANGFPAEFLSDACGMDRRDLLADQG